MDWVLKSCCGIGLAIGTPEYAWRIEGSGECASAAILDCVIAAVER
jgi:hypothetical protein